MVGKSDWYLAAFIDPEMYRAPGINDCLTLADSYCCPIIPSFV